MSAPHRQQPELFPRDPLQAAAAAGLRYVRDNIPGIRRRRCGRAFTYIGPDQGHVTDEDTLRRIRSLVIPPAWENVWICANPHGHIQAIGWDARGRKQYRYHPLYRKVRDQAKFGKLVAFGAVLAIIRNRVERDLQLPGLPREKVLAAVVRLLDMTYMRVGNEEYARSNDSFGLTTLRDQHVRIEGPHLRFHFRGKSGQEHTIQLTDGRLARIVKRCQEIPGYELFQYIDENGERCRVDSADVNAYLREITGQDFTAKDFRTWAGTMLAARELSAIGPCRNQSEGKRNIVAAVKRVAGQLGNRPATCRNYYIHPAIIDAYSNATLFQAIQYGAGSGLPPEEYSVLVLVAEYTENLAREAEKSAKSRRRKAA